MKIVVNHIKKLEHDKPTKAFATISLDKIKISGVRVVETKRGTFVSMPQERGRNGKWYDRITLGDKEVREAVTRAVLEEYNEA